MLWLQFFTELGLEMATLLAWLGNTDLRAATAEGEFGPGEGGLGPILGAVCGGQYSRVYLLSNHGLGQTEIYVAWLRRQFDGEITVQHAPLTSPTAFDEIYLAARKALDLVTSAEPGQAPVVHLSPGTSAMAAVWILLVKTRYPARLIESSREKGVREVNIPFELAAEFSPLDHSRGEEALLRLIEATPPAAAEFSAILHRSPVMQKTIALANRVAQREVPVLIMGESGTGKELFARAIHNASSRHRGPFVAVNCGAIPVELVDAELFGHEKGAFTGAGALRTGYFEAAEGGTLFLDEIGELPLQSQVRLLRALQEKEITRIGASRPISTNVRVISATNRTLSDEVKAGRFREDLFHRLAVGVLQLPPLRAREGDISLLIDSLLEEINSEASVVAGYEPKRLSVAGRKRLLQHNWPGNVRELHNTLTRASIWAEGETILEQDIVDSLALSVGVASDAILGRPINDGISLPDIMGEVAHHYLMRALDASGGNKSDAARLLGLGSHQTLSNWMAKYGVGSGSGVAGRGSAES